MQKPMVQKAPHIHSHNVYVYVMYCFFDWTFQSTPNPKCTSFSSPRYGLKYLCFVVAPNFSLISLKNVNLGVYLYLNARPLYAT